MGREGGEGVGRWKSCRSKRGEVMRLVGVEIRAVWYLISQEAAPNVCIRSTNAP